MENENAIKLHEYLNSISDNEELLGQFITLMNKQSSCKPITLHDGLSIYIPKNTLNYSYRIYNKSWGVDERKTCKTTDKLKAKNIAMKAWARYEVMKEHGLIDTKTKGETFIEFAERVVIPPMQQEISKFENYLNQKNEKQIQKQFQQKINGIKKSINHLRKKCLFLHNKKITELKLKDFEDFAYFIAKEYENDQININEQDGNQGESIKLLAWDTFSNYMTRVRHVLNCAVTEDLIHAVPSTNFNNKIKANFAQKGKRKDLSSNEQKIIFDELNNAIEVNKEKLTESQTSKYSTGKLNRLEIYQYYLNFILGTGARPGDECFLIRWSDFTIEKIIVSGKTYFDYYCKIRGGKTESKKADGRKIIVSKGSERSNIFEDCLTPLAKKHGFTGIKAAIESASEGYVFTDINYAHRDFSSKKDRDGNVNKQRIFSIDFTPYCFRHSYITKKIIETDEPLDRIAKQCGNSVEQIQKTYNHATTQRYRIEELKNAAR